MNFHAKSVENIFEELESSPKGLGSEEAKKRIQRYGLNQITETGKVSALKIFLSQFKSFLVIILIVATILASILGKWVDASVIFAILVINSVLGFIQEYRAEKAIEALKKLTAPKAKVIRNGKTIKIDASELVPGDIIQLETGDKVPADARLIDLSNLETQEANLTGESTPIKKELGVLKEDIILGDRKNMIFSGTIITKGRCTAVVISTGMNTEIGKIAKLVGETKRTMTPLQKKLASLGKLIGYITLSVAVIVFIVGVILQKSSIIDMVLTSISLAVAAIPEGLPAIVTIALAIGIQRMIKKNALVRRLPSVETLGDTTIICTDKTGTLTKNEMTVKKIFANNKIINVIGEGYSTKGGFYVDGTRINTKEIDILLKSGIICNDSKLRPQFIGDPTEIALLVSGEKASLSVEELNSKLKRIDEVPFDSVRKMMSTLNHNGKDYFVFTKGAVENVIECCSKISENGKVRKLTEKDKNIILNTNEHFAGSALRVLAFAYKPTKKEKIKENELIFLGLQAMIDPPREDAKEAMKKCEDAGIKVMMITGDHEITAKAIGKAFGLTGRVVNGKQLEKMSVEQLTKIVESTSIFARVNPEHKLKIVQALQKNGHIVAMTGDGVNDAPAIKRADIGISMGISGTDVAKEASDMILTDDNFASIVNSVEEGRGIYDNIRKFFAFLISGNIGEVFIIFFSMLLFLPLPLRAIHILLINLVTDGLPALALSVDPFEPDAMKQKPRNTKEKIYSGLNAFIVGYPIIMVIATLGIFIWVLKTKNDIVEAQTAVLFTIVMFEFYQALSCRSLKRTVFKAGILANKFLLIALSASLGVVLAIMYIPSLNPIFHTKPLGLFHIISIAIIALSGFAFIEISKFIKYRKIRT